MNPPPLSQHLTKASYTAVASAPPWDTIVIGSGMGGLAAAGMLAKQGERVLVLEKHSKLGGCTHEFEEKGVSFDTGLHYVGGQVWLPTSFPRRLFDHITDGAVEWIPMDDAFDVAVVDGKRLDVRGGETQIADLINRFPRDATKIRAYYAEIEREAGRVGKLSSDQIASGYVPHAVINAFWDSSFGQETVAKALDRLDITDVDLRKFLTYLAGDYGAFPDEASFTQHAITVMHYFNGAAYPRGGPAKIAEAVARVVTKSEGACLTRAPVQSLLLEKGKVTGVVLAGHDIPIRATKVISCVGAINTFTKLFPGPESGVALPALVAQARESIDKDIVASTAHCMLFAVLRGTKAELELPAANWWINSTRDGDFPSAFISFPSAKDPETWAKLHPDVSTCEVTVEADYDEFARWAEQPAKNRDADYAALKESWAKRMLDVLYAHFPQLKGKVDFYDASTPLSTEHNLNSVRGSAYGVKCTPARYRANRDWLKPGTSIPGLYLGGQDVLSCGVVGALVGGAVAACAASTSALLAMRPILHPIDDLHLVAHPGPEHKAELGVVADAEPEKEGWF